MVLASPPPPAKPDGASPSHSPCSLGRYPPVAQARGLLCLSGGEWVVVLAREVSPSKYHRLTHGYQ